MDEINLAVSKLIKYVESENYMGYDPYDAHNSFLPLNKLPQKLQFIISQIIKRSPINMRPVLGIKKDVHTKAMGLFLSAYCNLYHITKNEVFLNKANNIFNWIENNQSHYSKNLCWGFDYPYSNRNTRIDKGFPTVIHHSYILRGVYNYYIITRHDKAIDFIKEADAFILEDIPLFSYPEGICFGYQPGAIDCCYNASLHAAESLAIVNNFKHNLEYFRLIENAVQYVISRQKPSGVWFYSHGKDLLKEKKQIDFHQGFILESLFNIDRLTEGKLSHLVQPAIQSGLDFYFTNQFSSKGLSKFRLPLRYPVDIHSQAQGIITFSNFSYLEQKYADFADIIVNWTICNMQDKHGYFYYQKYKLFTNKISYIRWGQAWMLHALSYYLLMKQKNSIVTE